MDRASLILFFLVLTASFLLVIYSKNGIRTNIIYVEVCNRTAAYYNSCRTSFNNLNNDTSLNNVYNDFKTK